jgi:hypothetical protein
LEIRVTYRGHIRNGVAIIDAGITLPDGTPVLIEVAQPPSAFWANKSAAELAHEQGVTPIQTLNDFAGDWPPEESVEDFLAFLREGRR